MGSRVRAPQRLPDSILKKNQERYIMKTLEIHAGEGGQDAAIFAAQLANIYSRQLAAAG